MVHGLIMRSLNAMRCYAPRRVHVYDTRDTFIEPSGTEMRHDGDAMDITF